MNADDDATINALGWVLGFSSGGRGRRTYFGLSVLSSFQPFNPLLLTPTTLNYIISNTFVSFSDSSIKPKLILLDSPQQLEVKL